MPNYVKQGFYSGQPLKASQLEAMEDGIIEAQNLAQEGATGAANMEKGTGENATQQPMDSTEWELKNKHIDDIISTTSVEINEVADADGNVTRYMVTRGALGKNSSVFGGKGIALGKRSFVKNSSGLAYGESSSVEGIQCIAAGEGSHAQNGRTYAKGDYSSASGLGAVSIGIGSDAGGIETTAGGDYSFTRGNFTKVKEGTYFASAFGNETIATQSSQFVIGTLNEGRSDAIFEVGNGNADIGRVNAFVVKNDGSAELQTQGTSEKSIATVAHVNDRIGDANKLTYTLTADINTRIDQLHNKTHFTIGLSTNATGDNSIASGYSSTASGNNSDAGGTQTVAGGDSSFTRGNKNIIGTNAWFSAIFGTENVSNAPCQFIIGKHNNNKTDTLFEIGNGVDVNNCSNAFEVYGDGDIGIYKDGKIYSLHKMLAAYFTDTNLK